MMWDLFKTKKQDASVLVRLDTLVETNKKLTAQVVKLSMLAARVRRENKQLKEKMQRLKAKLYDAGQREEDVQADAVAAKNREELNAIHEAMHSTATVALKKHLKNLKKEDAE